MMAAQKSYQRIVCHTLSPEFRSATRLESVPFPALAPDELLVKNLYVGINASDVNFTAGRYLPGVPPPLYPGFEALGVVSKVGEAVKKFAVGDHVLISKFGCFSEYMLLQQKEAQKVPGPDPIWMAALGVSALTASIALTEVGQIKSGETVLVTAAAGGTGQFAVQLAKLSGCHVIGTCSSQEKAEMLKKLGCDRVIVYTKENLFKVLKSEYPQGVDVVYESVGGSTFQACVANLAVRGRLIVIGAVSGYQDQAAWTTGETEGKEKRTEREKESEMEGKKNKKKEEEQFKGPSTPLPMQLLRKSTSIRGFFLMNFAECIKAHKRKLLSLCKEGKVRAELDILGGGLAGVASAVEYLFSGRNKGKLLVALEPHAQARL